MNSTAFSRAPRRSAAAAFVLATASFLSLGAAQGQTSSSTPPKDTAAPGTKAATGIAVVELAQNAVTRYDNRWEVYGGLLYMNGKAGENLPKRYDMGGAEVMGTYWLGSHFGVPANHLGLAADYRFGAGTTPVLPAVGGPPGPNSFGLNRVLVYQDILTGGLQYRGPKNRYAAIDFHAFAGAAHGTFDTAITGYPQNTTQQPTVAEAGLYSNRTSPWAAAGGSIDFNYSPKVAVRLQPDLIFEHFGNETREFFGISMGLVYRLGKR